MVGGFARGRVMPASWRPLRIPADTAALIAAIVSGESAAVLDETTGLGSRSAGFGWLSGRGWTSTAGCAVVASLLRLLILSA